MAIHSIGAIGLSQLGGAGGTQTPQPSFSSTLKAEMGSPSSPQPTVARMGVQTSTQSTSRMASERAAAQAIDHLSASQSRMDRVLSLAQSGKSFSPAELLALQTQMYRASQELDLASRMVEKATGGVKQVLQTQV
jgi:hypothetical protein